MKIFARNILILIFPFVLMFIINEALRIKIRETPYSLNGIKAINSAEYLQEKCTWTCHNNTEYCKIHHVKYLKPYYLVTDFFYFGIIAALKSTGNYGVANIIFLVFLFPITILYFIIKSINLQNEIRKLSK
jgi:hypothetical protein